MMNAGNLKGKTRQTSDWRRRMIAFVSALTLLISSCGLTAFAETDEDIYSNPVTAPIPAANTSPEPEEGEAQATPAPEGQPEEGTEPQEAAGEGTEPEGEPEVSEEPEDLTVYEPGTLTAEADGVGITVDYTAEARVPEGTVLTLTRAAGGDLYSALKSASKVLKTEENATWKRELGEDAVFYAITLTDSEGNKVHPETGVTLTCTNLEIPADATGFVTGDNAENLDWKDTLTVGFLPDAIGYAYLKQVQIGTVTLTHEDRDYMVIAAYGPDAGFPADTELKVREILPGTPEYALYSGMTDEALNEDWAEITLERYFDIAFVANGEELEPKADVDVQIVFRDKIEQNEETEVAAVHIENNEANVIEAETDSTKSARHDDEAIDTVTFTSDSFSVYGVVQKKKIITKVLAADGNTYEIEISYTQEAEIPEESQVKVEEIPEGSDLWEAYRKQTAAALNADDVRLPGLYDISIIDAEGAKVESKAPVSVSIKLANAEANNEDLHVVHFTEEIPQELVEAEAKSEEQTEVQPIAEENKIESENIKANVEGDTVTFDTQGFSVYAFAYKIVTYYKTASGETYKITLNYDENSGISEGSTINVEEILPGDERYNEYLEKALKAASLTTEAAEITSEDATAEEETDTSEEGTVTGETTEKTIPENQYARFFDIEIRSNDQKIEPTGKVSVTIELSDIPEEKLADLRVIHFAENDIDIIAPQVDTGKIQFETTSFSVYAVLSDPRKAQTDDLNGRMATISRNGDYLMAETSGSNPTKIKKTRNDYEAALWYFETTGTAGEYYVYTMVGGEKKYMHLESNNENTANATLESTPQSLRIENPWGTGYIISRKIDLTRYYLNHWESGRNKDGFAGWHLGNSDALLAFTFPSATEDQRYAVIVQYLGQYYMVQNDGSLVPVNYDPESNTVEIKTPLLWNYVSSRSDHPNEEPWNLCIANVATGYDPATQLANGFLYRYISTEAEDGIYNEMSENGGKQDCGLRYTEDHKLIGLKDNVTGHYLGVGIINGQLHITGNNTSIADAVNVYFAYVNSVPVPSTGTHDDHTVNHIDISIQGDAKIKIPVKLGEYYDASGTNVIYTATPGNNILTVEGKVDVSTDDIKRATIRAYTKNANGQEIDVPNAFYITGYSGNEENYLSTRQVRIEGSFKVADLPTTENADNIQAVREARKAHRIYYTVSTVKEQVFKLKSPSGALLYDKEGNEIEVTVPIKLSASFDYWDDKRNECPPLRWDWNGYLSGKIISDGYTMSGMDFKLGVQGTATDVPALEIVKYVQKDDGSLIEVDGDYNVAFDIFYNATGDTNAVINKGVNEAISESDLNALISGGYNKIRKSSVSIGGTGIGAIYDYDIQGGMFYIVEDEDSIPQTVVDTEGNAYDYLYTRIETEYSWRTSGDDNKVHHADGTTAVPEVVGTYGDSLTNYLLYFHVFNVYSSEPKTDIIIEKDWADFQDGFGWEAEFNLEYADASIIRNNNNALLNTTFQNVLDENNDPVTFIIRKNIDQTEKPSYTYKDLPKYRTDTDGNVYELVYSATETSYKVWDTDENSPVYTYSSASGVYNPSDKPYMAVYTHDANEDADGDYTLKISNGLKYGQNRQFIDVTVQKEWKDASGNSIDALIQADSASFAEFTLKRKVSTSYKDLSRVVEGSKITVNLKCDNEVVVTKDFQLGSKVVFEATSRNDINQDIYSDDNSIRERVSGKAGERIVTTPFMLPTDPNLNNGVININIGNRGNYISYNITDALGGNDYDWDKEWEDIIFRLPEDGKWYKEFKNLTKEESFAYNDNVNVNKYTYYLVENDCYPDDYVAKFTVAGALLYGIDSNCTVIATNMPKKPLIVKKEWNDIEDVNNYPEIRFTLYQGLAYGNSIQEGQIYESQTGESFVDIPLNSDNNWQWECPTYLPEQNEHGQNVGYYVVEKTSTDDNGKRVIVYNNSALNADGTVQTYGSPIDISSQNEMGYVWIYDYYNNKNDNHAYHQQSNMPNGWEGGIAGNNGTLIILNGLRKYKQMDIKKKIMEYFGTSLYTTTQDHNRWKNMVLEIQLYRQIFTLDQTGIDAKPLVDWEKYGVPFMIGYGENESVRILENENNFPVKYAGGDWHWRILDNDDNRTGLPAYGYYLVDGERIPVRYRYIPFEIGCYSNTNRDPFLNNMYEWMVGLQPAAWDGDGQQYILFPKVMEGQDQDRIMNIQATDLYVEKKWAGTPSNIAEVYVKIYRQHGSNEPEDYTVDIAKRTNALSFYGIVSDPSRLKTIDDGVLVLGLTPQTSGVWIHGVPFTPIRENAGEKSDAYYYWVEEVGYRDIHGNIFKDEEKFDPHYSHYNYGDDTWSTWVTSPTKNKIKLSTKGNNKLRINNTPTLDITVEKEWYNEEGDLLERPFERDPKITSIKFKIKREKQLYDAGGNPTGENTFEYLTFGGDETLSISEDGKYYQVKAAENKSTSYTITQNESLYADAWTAVIDGLQEIAVENFDDETEWHYTYYIEEATTGDWDIAITGNPVNNGNAKVTIKNKDKNPGSLKITKLVALNNTLITDHSKTSPVDKIYTFKIEGPVVAASADKVTKFVQITVSKGEAASYKIADSNDEDTWKDIDPVDSGFAIVENLNKGDYVITELDLPGDMSVISIAGGKKTEGKNDANLTARTVTAHVTAGDTEANQPDAQVTYTNNRNTIDIDATKTWKNSSNENINTKITNAKVIFELQSSTDGENWSKVEKNINDVSLVNPVTIEVTEANPEAWKTAWEALPKYDGDTLIQYRVAETYAKVGEDELVTDASPVVQLVTFTDENDLNKGETNIDNTLPTTDIKVVKTWGENSWDSHIIVEMTLKVDGKTPDRLPNYTTTEHNDETGEDEAETHEQKVTVWLSSEEALTGHTWKNLPVYTDNGEKIDYTVEETGMQYRPNPGDDPIDITNWSAAFTRTKTPSTSGSTVTVTIDNTPMTTSIQVTKVWLLNNKPRTDKTSINYELYRKDESYSLGLSDYTLSYNIQAELNESGKIKYVSGEGGGWQTVTISGLPMYQLVITPADGATTATASYELINYYVVETSEHGSTQLTYSITPTGESEGEETETPDEAYTSAGKITIYNRDTSVNIGILKIDETTRNNDEGPMKLQGAKFKLFKGSDETNNEGQTNTIYTTQHGEETTNEEGVLTFSDLPEGKYKIVESEAPSGYNNITGAIYFTISVDGLITWTDENGILITDQNKPVMVEYAPPTDTVPATFTVGNTPGVELPSTGGSGTMIYTIAGMLLITLAGVLLVSRKRKNEQ